MNTYEKIQERIKNAMIQKDALTRDCLRSLTSDIKNSSINAGKELTEEIVVKCIHKAVKQHRDSIEQFSQAGRKDLAEKETLELKVLEEYLPKTLSEEETKEILNNILQSIEATKKNFGLIMKQLPSDVDKKIASKILNSLLK